MMPTARLRALVFFALTTLCLVATGAGTAEKTATWPALRGTDGRGISEETGLPVFWSVSDNVVWSIPIPSKGHSATFRHRGRIYIRTLQHLWAIGGKD